MEELIQKLQNIHGLSSEQSHGILNTIAGYLKEKFPMVGGAIDNLFQSGTTLTGPGTTPADVQSTVANPAESSDFLDKISNFIPGETGEKLEMEDIANASFMPASCMEGNVENFYKEMEKHEAHFLNLVAKAKAEGKKLKFVAKFENGKASVGLQHIDPQHDFYHLYGKDNAVLFYTDRYVEQPLVIKGAGAGAEVTASGVFADIIRAAAPSS